MALTKVTYPDSEKLLLGSGDDLQIYHDGSHAILDNDTGDTYIKAAGMISLNPANSEDGLLVKANGAVELYNDNVKVFSTGGSSCTIYGTEGAEARLFLYADEGDDNADKWRIESDTAGNFNIHNLADGSWDRSIACAGSGNVELFYDDSKKFETLSSGVKITGALSFANTGQAISLHDDRKLHVGSGDDMEIFHDGTNTMIDNNTGELKISSGTLRLRADNGGCFNEAQTETAIDWAANGAVRLYYDNTKKFETNSGGVSVTGHCYFPDSNGTYFGAGEDLRIYHDGTNSRIVNTTGQLSIAGDTIAITNAAVSENLAKFIADGGVNLYYDNSEKFKTTSTGATVTGTVEQTGYCLDEWRLHTSLRGDTNPITNWERCDTSGMANKLIDDSSGMTESSGVFSFPSTGKWKITTWMQWQTPSGQTEAWAGMFGTFTQDNSSYTTQDWGYAAMAAGSSYQKSNGGFTVDVTSTTNCKLKFYCVMQQSNNSTGTYLLGQTAYNATWVRFERIGDT